MEVSTSTPEQVLAPPQAPPPPLPPLEQNPEPLAQLAIKGEENGHATVETDEVKPCLEEEQKQPQQQTPQPQQTPQYENKTPYTEGQQQSQEFQDTDLDQQGKRKRKLTPMNSSEFRQDSEEPGQKKRRGRPKGSKNKPRSESKGEEIGHTVPDSAVTVVNEAKTPYQTQNYSPLGVHLKPLVLTIQQGEDITQKLKNFCEEHQCSVVVQAATGTLSEATLTQQQTRNGVVLKDTFTILSLSGALLRSAEDLTVTWFLTASLAAPDGGVVGGQVSGALAAASSVIIVIGYWKDHPTTHGTHAETTPHNDQNAVTENGGENDQNYMNEVVEHTD
eukprot:TRINITY_DN5979_c0_g2_i1.p1 TRINITY_DN5979_c0_g2~~TRINITY_DN5979_c0_g2_i1.p1  ORF type:complete len:333 (-),score=64.12 TRINITY_DN5979_c0_g2_i1:325-1323(-)